MFSTSKSISLCHPTKSPGFLPDGAITFAKGARLAWNVARLRAEPSPSPLPAPRCNRRSHSDRRSPPAPMTIGRMQHRSRRWCHGVGRTGPASPNGRVPPRSSARKAKGSAESRDDHPPDGRGSARQDRPEWPAGRSPTALPGSAAAPARRPIGSQPKPAFGPPACRR